MIECLVVGLGGALGAIGRYLLGLLTITKDFPYITFGINFLGAILIGIITGYIDKNMLVSKNLILFLKIGLCGGFTTFSTFSLETLTLLENNKYMIAGVYIFSSVFLCILGVYLGKQITKL